jgi:predicted metal-dependent phosphoesterase TrpH
MVILGLLNQKRIAAIMLKIDMHVHTHYSRDGLMSEEDITAACQKKDLSGVAITDHNTIKGALDLRKMLPFKIIVGEEIQTQEGEIMGYFLYEEIPPHLPLEETIKIIKAQGGLVGIPHPFGSFRRSKIKQEALERIINQVDIIEVFNSRNIFAKDNQLAVAFARKHRLFSVVGSDAHISCEVGKAYIEIKDFNDPKHFLNNLMSAKLVTKSSGLWVHVVTKWGRLLKK